MQGLRTEMAAFLTACLTGMIAACAYLCIRKLRRVIPHTLTAIAVEDGVYWVSTAIYIFVQIYVTSSGSIRWYFVIGTGAGLLVFMLLGRIFRKIGAGLYKKRNEKSSKKY